MKKVLEDIRNNCTICGGSGVISTKTETGIHLEDCKCIRIIAKEIAMIKANIPEQYRSFTLKNLTKEFKTHGKNSEQLAKVDNYKSNLEKNIKEGRGLWFISNPGLAKSSIIVVILKQAIKEGYCAYFERASHLLSLKFAALKDEEARKKIEYIIDKVDILAIEELEKIYLMAEGSFQRQLFFEFMSDIYDSKKSILVSSNIGRDKVEINFPPYIIDRLKPLENIHFFGKSGRDEEFVNVENDEIEEDPVEATFDKGLRERKSNDS